MDLQQQTNFERKYYLIKSKKYKNIIINHLLIWLKRFWYDKAMDTFILFFFLIFLLPDHGTNSIYFIWLSI